MISVINEKHFRPNKADQTNKTVKVTILQPNIICSCVIKPFNMKLVVVPLVAILFGAMRGKKEKRQMRTVIDNCMDSQSLLQGHSTPDVPTSV